MSTKPWSGIEAEDHQFGPLKRHGRTRIVSSRNLWLVRAGEIALIHEGRERICPQGTVIWRRPGQLLRIGATQHPHQVALLRIRHPAWAAQIPADLDALNILHGLDSLSQHHGPIIPVTSATVTILDHHFTQLIATWKDPSNPYHAMRMKAECLLFLAALHADPEVQAHWQQPLSPQHISTADRIEPAMRILGNRPALLSQSWPVKELAKRCDLSVAQFHRCFKAAIGQSPRNYIAGLRILHACELLQQADLTLAEVAQRCGFSTTARFHAAFHKIHNKGPGAWRKELFK